LIDGSTWIRGIIHFNLFLTSPLAPLLPLLQPLPEIGEGSKRRGEYLSPTITRRGNTPSFVGKGPGVRLGVKSFTPQIRVDPD